MVNFKKNIFPLNKPKNNILVKMVKNIIKIVKLVLYIEIKSLIKTFTKFTKITFNIYFKPKLIVLKFTIFHQITEIIKKEDY
jgi:hypothetical protein